MLCSRLRSTRHALLSRAFSAWLLFMSVPGAQEAIEDVVHLIADGHTAHDSGHEGEQPEHCCTGLFHFCACHAQSVATPLMAALRVAAVPASERLAPPDDAGKRLTGFHTLPFRPPTHSA
jgi:hypothetical protein